MSDTTDWQAFAVELAENAKRNLDAKDDEIDRLKAQLKEAEDKGRVLVGMCRDLKARVAELSEALTESQDWSWIDAHEDMIDRALSKYPIEEMQRLSDLEEKYRFSQQAERAANAILTDRIEELETMVKVFRGCIETGLMPKPGSPCHDMVIQLVGERGDD